MIESILSYGVAVGAVYALIGITYNVMFSASRVFSFTAGSVGMLGGVFGSVFISKLGLPVAVGFLLTVVAGALLGIITEILTVRPVLKSIDQHLYVLSTLAASLMIQQLTAIYFSTDAVPFPKVVPIDTPIFDQKFWLPILACAVTVLFLEYLFKRTLIGHAFLAISEDNYAARALGLPEQGLRMASYALAGVIGVVAGFASGQMMFASLANGPLLNFYGFVPVALGGMGSNRGALIGGILLGLFQQMANYYFGGVFASVAVFAVFIIVLLARPEGIAGSATARRV
ncbi:MAG: branched-chain amino acid ABC transporter permease [Proteobacteria bacterium]|nr:branched-chain amino acid ABC transporter permease [Pseudomonadota bacterium]